MTVTERSASSRGTGWAVPVTTTLCALEKRGSRENKSRRMIELKVSLEEAADMIPIDELERRFPHRVMATRQRDDLMIEVQLPRLLDHLPGKPHRKSGVIFSVDKESLFPERGIAVDIIRRA